MNAFPTPGYAVIGNAAFLLANSSTEVQKKPKRLDILQAGHETKPPLNRFIVEPHIFMVVNIETCAGQNLITLQVLI